MTKTLKTRRQFVSTTMIGLLAAPSLLRAQEPSAVRRNISSFSADPWQDHFDNLQHGAILCDIDSRAVQYWSEDESVYKLYPSSVPASEELTRRGYTK
ncbi:L,D-transpeptidase, partial [Sulfitobacter sp. 1A12779]